MKSDKIYTYIVLVFGLIVWLFYFYLKPFNPWYGDYKFGFSTWNTNFDRVWRNIFGHNYITKFLIDIFFWISQILYLLSLFYLRKDLVKILKKIHNKLLGFLILCLIR